MNDKLSVQEDTICAPATAGGMGAIAIIRISGVDAITIADEIFSKPLETSESHTVLFGTIKNNEQIIDEVLLSVFRDPKSYTGENMVEISCHGSVYIQQEIMKLLISKGCRPADPGEFTKRAFLNGKLDLLQAEAVSDLIASDSMSSHQLAMKQMRGGFSNELKNLRDKLIHFSSLVELELDFSEEDVEFANRDALKELIAEAKQLVQHLVNSFSKGNVIKEGIPVTIAGAPNAGKSTLLNGLLNEEKAITSDIAGTTRDVIEDEVIINGVKYRFMDTAGIRDTSDQIETAGIGKTFEKIDQSALVLYMIDCSVQDVAAIDQEILAIQQKMNEHSKLLIIGNKLDLLTDSEKNKWEDWAKARDTSVLLMSAKASSDVEKLTNELANLGDMEQLLKQDVVLTNARHFDALSKCLDALLRVQDALFNQVTGDLMAVDIRQALHFLGEITGEVTTDDILGSIFSKFCIGK